MQYAVILSLDPAKTDGINQVSDAIRVTAGIASGRGSVPPHVTLGVLETDDEQELIGVLRTLASALPPIPLRFSSLGCFPGERAVIFVAPVVNAELLTIHQRFSDVFNKIDPGNDGLYRPGVWVPHCTLALDLTADRIDQAFAAARRLPLPLAGSAVGIGIVRLAAAELVVSLPLGDET